MIENTVKEEIKPKLRIAWGKLAGGTALLLFAVGGGGFDMYNNWMFGLEKSVPIAGTFILAAIGLMALPGLAEGKTDIRTWFLVGVCGLLCLYAGGKNHMASQRNHDLAQAAVTTRYDQAQAAIKDAEADIRQAKIEIAGVHEILGSEELQRLHHEARERASKESSGDRGGCGRRCRAAEDEAKSYLSRIASAKAKEDAQGRLDAAQARMDAEKAKAPAAPKQAGESAQEETLMAVLLLLVTIVGATFFERGVKEIRAAVDWEVPKKVRASVKTDAQPVATPAARGLAGFVGLCKHGEFVPIKDAHAVLERWWKVTGQKGEVPAARTLSAAFSKDGFDKRVDRNKRSFFAVKTPDAGLRLVAGQDL